MLRRILLICTVLDTVTSAQGINTTTLAQALINPTTGNSGGNLVYLNSCANVLAPGGAISEGGIGNSQGANYYLLLIDAEFFRVNGVSSAGSSCQVAVERGVQGSSTAAHSVGATVYTAPASLFEYLPPYYSQPFLPRAPFFVRVGRAIKSAWRAVF